jgi:hypothetical protein
LVTGSTGPGGFVWFLIPSMLCLPFAWDATDRRVRSHYRQQPGEL